MAERRESKEPELGLHPTADKEKIALAQRLRRETTMSLKWIALRLQMGSLEVMRSTCWCSANRHRKK